MARKIPGIGGPKAVGETPQSSSVKEVDSVKATDVTPISSTKGQSGLQRIRGGYAINSETRDQLFQLIHEEADRLFGPSGIPQHKRKTVEGAVKMAIDASVVETEDDSKNSNKKTGG